MFFKRKEEVKENVYGTTKMQKVSAKFVTVDGEEHYTGSRWRWCHSDALCCSVGEFLMIDINEEGYIKDENNVMYILHNIRSIEWNVDKELTVIDKTKQYKLWYTYEELEKMGIVE